MAGFLVLLREHFEVVRASTPSLLDRVYIRSTVSRTRMKIRSNRWMGGRGTFTTIGRFMPSWSIGVARPLRARCE